MSRTLAVPCASMMLALFLSYVAGGARAAGHGHRGPGGMTGECTKIALSVHGDPALCLPAEKPSDPEAKACKEYVLECCCLDDHVVHPGKVTEARWKLPVSWLSVEGVPGFTTGQAVAGKKGEFVTLLTGPTHKVKICIRLGAYEAIVGLFGKKDCYIFPVVRVEGTCEADGKREKVKAQFELGVARHLQAKICLRNVKKAGAGAGDPANSALDVAAFAPQLEAELNRIYAQFCLSFKVEAGEDVILPAGNFEADGTLKADAKDATNEDLARAADPGCLDIFAAARLPQGVNGGTPTSKEAPYSLVDDGSGPITGAHELGHLLGWKFVITDPDDVGVFGTMNVCRPSATAKSDLLMLDNALRRTDAGLLTDGNLDKMWPLICAHATHP